MGIFDLLPDFGYNNLFRAPNTARESLEDYLRQLVPGSNASADQYNAERDLYNQQRTQAPTANLDLGPTEQYAQNTLVPSVQTLYNTGPQARIQAQNNKSPFFVHTPNYPTGTNLAYGDLSNAGVPAFGYPTRFVGKGLGGQNDPAYGAPGFRAADVITFLTNYLSPSPTPFVPNINPHTPRPETPTQTLEGIEKPQSATQALWEMADSVDTRRLDQAEKSARELLRSRKLSGITGGLLGATGLKTAKFAVSNVGGLKDEVNRLAGLARNDANQAKNAYQQSFSDYLQDYDQAERGRGEAVPTTKEFDDTLYDSLQGYLGAQSSPNAPLGTVVANTGDTTTILQSREMESLYARLYGQDVNLRSNLSQKGFGTLPLNATPSRNPVLGPQLFANLGAMRPQSGTKINFTPGDALPAAPLANFTPSEYNLDVANDFGQKLLRRENLFRKASAIRRR